MINKTRGAARRACILAAILLLCALSTPAYAKQKEFYNYEGRYTLYLSDEAYAKISKVNNTLMSIRYGSGALLTINTANYYETLPEEEKTGKADSYTLGSEVLDATFNSEEYMKDYFDNRLKHISGEKELLEMAKVSINSHEFWCCHFNLVNKKTSLSNAAAKLALAEKERENAAEGAAEQPEAEPDDTQPPTDNPEDTPKTDDNIYGEGKIYFTLYKGYSYSIQLTNKDGTLSDIPAIEDTVATIKLGLRQTKTFTYMWSGIALLVLYLCYLIVRILSAVNPKKALEQIGQKEPTKPIPQLAAAPISEEAEEAEEISERTYVAEKARLLAEELETTKVFAKPAPAETESPAPAVPLPTDAPARPKRARKEASEPIKYDLSVPNTEIIEAMVNTKAKTPPTPNRFADFIKGLPMLIMLCFASFLSNISMKSELRRDARARRYNPSAIAPTAPKSVDISEIARAGLISEEAAMGTPAAIVSSFDINKPHQKKFWQFWQ